MSVVLGGGMGVQLRQMLRRLCVEAGWSYTVFWRLVHVGDQMHLEWGDGHCERMSGTPTISGFEAMDMHLREKAAMRNCEDGNGAELGFLAEDRVATLVNRIMVSQIHEAGVGIVGQVAVSGSHQWIIQDDLIDCVSASKVLSEINQQFLAGIKTVAIVPVLPHGVVQLGSTKMVVEDLGFVHHVKKLFSQLVSEPRILSPSTNNSLIQKMQIEGSTGIPVVHSMDTELNRIKGMNSDQSMTQMYSKIPPWVISNLVHSNDQVKGGSSRTQARPDKQDFRSTQNKWHCGSQGQYLSANSGSCSDSLTFLERQLSSVSCEGPHPRNMKNGISFCDGTDTKLNFSESYLHSLTNVGLLDGRMRLIKNASDTESFLPQSSGGSGIKDGSASASNVTCHPISSKLMPNNYELSYMTGISKMIENTLDAGEHNLENYLVEDINIPRPDYMKHYSCPESLLGKVQDFSLNISNNDPKNLSYHGDTSVDNGSSANTGAASSIPVPEAVSENNMLGIVELHNKLRHMHDSFNNVATHSCKLNNNEQHASTSACIGQNNECPLVDPSVDIISSRGMFEDASPDQLLDAVISKIWSGGNQSNNNNMSHEALETNLIGESLHSNYLANDMQHLSQNISAKFLDVSPKVSEPKQEKLDLLAHSSDTFTGYSDPILGYRSEVSLSMESGKHVNSDSISAGRCKSTGELGKLTRKRSRPGDNPRPRPKDRQLIQDRIKELRGIVPDGVKCSIDALLDKTIKHMLFLQSVTKYADQLKGTAEPRITSKDGGLLLQDSFEGGATWAFEVGSQSVMCPIIVEDLNRPRQMLVEMLCEGRGLFIEIADFIRGLGLTILKGVIEARNAKVWARFAVEANRDVTRMEIFLSLVHLLEPTMGNSNTPEGASSGSLPHKTPNSSGLLDCVL